MDSIAYQSNPSALLPSPSELTKKRIGVQIRGWINSLSVRDLLILAFSRDHKTLLFAHVAILLFVYQDRSFKGHRIRDKALSAKWKEAIQRFAVAAFATVFP